MRTGTSAGSDPSAAAGAGAAAAAPGPSTVRLDVPSRWLSLPGGVHIATPDTIDQMTTYVLEEQGDWFEDEIGFVRELLGGGETVLDVGANHGVYALSMARAVGATGRVVAVEPASATAIRLRASAEANGFRHLEVLECAISDHEGEAVLHTGSSSELSSLAGAPGDAGGSERVRVTTIDRCVRDLGCASVSFVKLDVEGEEIRAIDGATGLLERDEPLVMVEYKHGPVVNRGLFERLLALGYATYRLVPGLGLLVPHPIGTDTDGYLLNVFAARPDRAAALERRGLLARRFADEGELPDAPSWSTVVAEIPAVARLGDHAGFGQAGGPAARHRTALERYGLSQRRDLDPSVRARALQSALEVAIAPDGAPDEVARLLTRARLAAAFGARAVALEILQKAVVLVVERGEVTLREPFLPACPRFDSLDPGDRLELWTVACVLEQRERVRAYSTYFSGRRPDVRTSLEILATLGFPCAEMDRRLALVSSDRSAPRRASS